MSIARVFGLVALGFMWARMAKIALPKSEESFYKAKIGTAKFFMQRLLPDIVHAYWSHPTAWSEMGWGGPASPRGYVRMGYDERDPWEAAAVRNGDIVAAYRKNRRVG